METVFGIKSVVVLFIKHFIKEGGSGSGRGLNGWYRVFVSSEFYFHPQSVVCLLPFVLPLPLNACITFLLFFVACIQPCAVLLGDIRNAQARLFVKMAHCITMTA